MPAQKQPHYLEIWWKKNTTFIIWLLLFGQTKEKTSKIRCFFLVRIFNSSDMVSAQCCLQNYGMHFFSFLSSVNKINSTVMTASRKKISNIRSFMEILLLILFFFFQQRFFVCSESGSMKMNMKSREKQILSTQSTFY